MENDIIPKKGYELERLRVEPMMGRGALQATKSVLIAAKATMDAVVLTRRLSPRAVLSVGGYAAGPMALGAALLAIPLAVLEPNSVLGVTNRILAPMASRGYIAWPEVAFAFRSGRTRHVGVPLREGFSIQPPYSSKNTAQVVILGGSQGASALNERIPEAISRVVARVPQIHVTHQAGRGKDVAVRAAYERFGIAGHANVVPFLEDVSRALGEADLVIARSGAGTLSEIAAVGRASLLVPFPHAAGDHQARNALAFAKEGAATCVRQEAADVSCLAKEITRLLVDSELRSSMASRARELARTDAALTIARDLLALGRVNTNAGQS